MRTTGNINKETLQVEVVIYGPSKEYIGETSGSYPLKTFTVTDILNEVDVYLDTIGTAQTGGYLLEITEYSGVTQKYSVHHTYFKEETS